MLWLLWCGVCRCDGELTSASELLTKLPLTFFLKKRFLRSRVSCDILMDNCDSWDLLLVRGSKFNLIFLPSGGVAGNFLDVFEKGVGGGVMVGRVDLL